MTTMKKYTVHRTMQDGATEYLPGDERELTEADAVELVSIGALSLVGEEPLERVSGVQHTFGKEPSAVNDGGYSIADPDSAITVQKPTKAKSASNPA